MEQPATKSCPSDPTKDVQKRLEMLELELAALIERNQRVDTKKAWETSRARLLSITAITYVTMLLVFTVLGSQRPLLDAFVPTTGFFLSTLSLPLVRGLWERYPGHDKDRE